MGISMAFCFTASNLTSTNRSRPAFAVVRFPNKTFTGYIGEGVSLWSKFGDIVGQFVDVTKGFVEAAAVKPRTKIKEVEQEQA